MDRAGVDVTELEPVAQTAAARGETPMYVAVDGHAAAVVTVADTGQARVRRGRSPSSRRSASRCG